MPRFAPFRRQFQEIFPREDSRTPMFRLGCLYCKGFFYISLPENRNIHLQVRCFIHFFVVGNLILINKVDLLICHIAGWYLSHNKCGGWVGFFKIKMQIGTRYQFGGGGSRSNLPDSQKFPQICTPCSYPKDWVQTYTNGLAFKATIKAGYGSYCDLSRWY